MEGDLDHSSRHLVDYQTLWELGFEVVVVGAWIFAMLAIANYGPFAP